MTDEIKIPYGYVRVTGQLQKGDGVWDNCKQGFVNVKRQPTEVIIRKTRMLYPCAMPDGIIAIRRARVEQETLKL